MNSFVKTYIGLFVFLSLLLFIVFSSLFMVTDPTTTHLIEKNAPPCLSHWFGTDELGRDLFSRSIQGLHISLCIGLWALIIDLSIGVLWGTISAFSSHFVDTLLTRMAGILFSIHPVLVGIIFSMFLGYGLMSIIFSLLCVGWVQVSQTTRVLVKTALNTEYVLSARALGTHPIRIFFVHILPNIVGSVLAASMLSIPQAIFSEASLSFLGIGIQPPLSSLGSIINDSLPSLRFFPWKLIFPVGLLSLLIFSILLFVEGISAKYDPKQLLMEKNIE